MNDAPPPHRMTDAELDAAVARMFPPADLTPLPAADVLAGLVWALRSTLLDLWTLSDSVDALPRRTAPATLADLLPSIAGHLDTATRELEAVAAALGVPLPPESPLFDA